MIDFLTHLWSDDAGQDIAEYAVMLTVILVLVIVTVQLIGTNASAIFTKVGDILNR